MRSNNRPSPVWLGAAALAFMVSVGTGVGALVHQVDATRPSGEGELFAGDAGAAAERLQSEIDAGSTLHDAVRRIRHDLRIEAVSVLDDSGVFEASTSSNLVGESAQDPYLRFAHSNGRFGAIANPVGAPILIDGVEEWAGGAVLYQVIQPLPEGRSLWLYYDVAELLSRRAGEEGIQSSTVQLAAISVVTLVGVILALLGRSVALRRIREAAREAELLAVRSEELEEHNRRLDEARAEAERALALAEETNRVRSEFVLMINHELRTPLTSVVTGTDLLRDGEVDDPQRTALLEDMQRDGRRLMELISNMLAVARIENRGLDYALRPTVVSDVLAAVTASTGAVRGVRDVAADVMGVRLRTDRDGLTHLLVSLAENAVTHGAGSVEIDVTFDLPEEIEHRVGALPGEAVHFHVVDDGPGIDREFLPNAFEKFEKDSFSSGTGLGLYMARMMVEAIEGAISVITGDGGTTMVVSVPLERVRERAAA